MDLSVDGVASSAAKGRTQQPLEHAEVRLDLPALSVLGDGPTPTEFATVGSRGGVLAGGRRPASNRRDDRANAQLLSQEAMVILGVVSGVAQQRLEGMSTVGLQRHTMELQVVRFGATVDHDAQEEMTVDVTDGRKLGITALIVAFVAPAATSVVAGNVSRLQTRGVDGDQAACLADHSCSSTEMNRRIKESTSAPFFSRRRSA